MIVTLIGQASPILFRTEVSSKSYANDILPTSHRKLYTT